MNYFLYNTQISQSNSKYVQCGYIKISKNKHTEQVIKPTL